VLFVDDTEVAAVVNGLRAGARSAGGAYLLLAAPESPDYATVLRDEVDQLSAAFRLEPLLQNRSVGLFKLVPN
jgi:hypothetical protein